ncbi:MAG: T9SS type A sorting domain-containing protein [Bacteroidota bacterium]|nr:T9SS type A sorting domain-containing protein [Bacteroidota bacterium]
MKNKLQLLLQSLVVLPFCLIFVFSAKATIHQVSVSSNSFTPASITTVEVGDTIRWNWVSGTHTTTSLTVPSGAASWFSQMSSSVTSFDYKVTHAGNYTYQCDPHAANMTGSFTASLTTGITSTSSLSKDVNIYPNPFTNSIHIDKKEAGYTEAIITDVLGKKILSINLNDKITKIDDSNYPEITLIPSGMYFITLIGTKNKNTVRIIKSGK